MLKTRLQKIIMAQREFQPIREDVEGKVVCLRPNDEVNIYGHKIKFLSTESILRTQINARRLKIILMVDGERKEIVSSNKIQIGDASFYVNCNLAENSGEVAGIVLKEVISLGNWRKIFDRIFDLTD